MTTPDQVARDYEALAESRQRAEDERRDFVEALAEAIYEAWCVDPAKLREVVEDIAPWDKALLAAQSEFCVAWLTRQGAAEAWGAYIAEVERALRQEAAREADGRVLEHERGGAAGESP